MSGIKITHAFDSNGVRVSSDNYDALPKKFPLICPDPKCNAYVDHVNGYKRESYGKQQFIPAFFRLEKGHNHANDCAFSAFGRETIVAGDSDCEVKDALAKGELIFRVHVMDSEERDKLKVKAGEFHINPPNDTAERKYRKKGRRATYVRTMDSLLDIYHHGVSNPIDRSKIQLVIGGNLVKWIDFFYSTNHLGSLRTRLINEGIVQVAVILKVHIIGLPNAKLGRFQFIECNPKTTGNGRKIYTTIKLAKNMPVSTFTLGSQIMVLGKFSIPDDADRVTPIYLGNEVRTLVSHPLQVVEF